MASNEKYWTRKQWGKTIGFFLMRFANIEEVFYRLKLSLDAIQAIEKNLLPPSTHEAPKSWHGLKLKQKTTKLINQIERLSLVRVEDTQIKSEIANILQRLQVLNDTRNTLAHGTFTMKDGCTPETQNYCVFSRLQMSDKGAITADVKVLHADDLESGISESTHIEMSLSSCVNKLVRTYNLKLSNLNYSLTFDSRAREGLLALEIGDFVVYMGDIENLVHRVYQSVLNPKYNKEFSSPTIKLNGYWDSLTLTKQIQDLRDRLPETYEYEKLRKVLGELQRSGLIDNRNLLTHAKISHQLSSNSEKLQLLAVRQTRKGPETLPEKAIRNSILTASKFSGSLAEALAMARMALMRPIKIQSLE